MRFFSTFVLLLSVSTDGVSADGNRLAHLDHLDPYYVSENFPKLTTPQWVGTPGVDCVVVLAIDDMRNPAKYEQYLRPILRRLKQIDGRAPVSIMTNSVDPNDEESRAQIQTWLAEGLSIEVHTIDHPCPLLSGNDFAKAKSTYDRCVDLVDSIPKNRAVAFRMPCCDSLNTPSPRFWSEIFEKSTPHGKHLSIDSSVFCITNDADPRVNTEQAYDADGQPKFQKYLPFPSFVNTIQNYPYPYVIGRTCWEFPCIVPSDWEAQNLQQPNNPRTVADMKTALDVVVKKQGTFNLVFHPHGWIRADQIVELIDHAASQYGDRVKFLTFGECDERIRESLLNGFALRAGSDTAGNSISNTRILDINGDGFQDVVRFDFPNMKVHSRIWQPARSDWLESAAEFEGSIPRFGILNESNEASIVFLAPTGDQILAMTMNNGSWTQRVVASVPSHLDAKRISDLRLRDLDADGICEIMIGYGDTTAVLHRTRDKWNTVKWSLPSSVRFDAELHDALRFVDVDEDGDLDCLFSDGETCSLHLFESLDAGWSKRVFVDDRSTGEAKIPPFVRTDGTHNGAWIHSGTIWYQNEDTSRLPDHVDRRKLKELLNPNVVGNNASLFPPARTPEASLAAIKASSDVAVELAAAEPLVEDPVAFDWDVDGSLWVVEMRDYPNGTDGNGKQGGRVKHLVDTNRDGTFDKATLFLDDLPFPTGVKTWRDGILVTAAPDILFAKDTDGDGRADHQETLYSGFGEGNQQHRVNGLVWGLDGWVYVANGDSGGTVISRKTGKRVEIGGRDLRIHPDSGDIEAIAGQTQFGRCVDEKGNWFGGNNSFPIWHYVRDDSYSRRNPHYSGPSARRQIQRSPGASPVFPTSKILPRFNDFDRANRFTSACSPIIYRDQLIGHRDASYFYVCEPVHNLVHREIMTKDGISFRTERLPEESNSEFFSSSDNWCRPVMVRTGPDGCLWIADMYRLVIEHPTWIPTDWQMQVDVRSGSDMGRIYRLVPNESANRKSAGRRDDGFETPLDQLTIRELAHRLEHPNGWHRDMAQQLLLWRDDPSSAGALESLIQSTSNEVAKIYALHTLRLLDDLKADVAVRCIKDASDDVSRHAMRNAEHFINNNDQVGPAIIDRIARAKKLNTLHQQAAYTLGEWKGKQAAGALARLALSFDDEYLTAAVVSSTSAQNIEHGLVTMRQQLNEHNGSLPNPDFVSETLRQALIIGEPNVVRLAAETFALSCKHASTTWKFETFQSMKHAMAQRPNTDVELRSVINALTLDLNARAISIAVEPSRPIRERVAAIRLLAADRNFLKKTSEELLSARHPPEVNVATIEALLSDSNAIPDILENWSAHAPRLRSEVLDRLVARADSTIQLLQAIDRGDISAKDIGVARQHQIRRHENPEVRRLSEKLFGAPTANERASVVSRYLKHVSNQGNPDRGLVLFKAQCAACHRVQGFGNDVGPDLAALSDKSPRALTSAILDPNRSIEERFLSYSIQTNDGLIVNGAIAEETSNSLSIVGSDGKQKTILRNQIKKMQSSGLSLMPEGFEKELSPVDVSDLVAYIRKQTTSRKLFPGNMPQVAPVRNDGSIRLFAIHANVFGPSLVFEEKHRNLGFWASSNDRATWDLEVAIPGKYDVRIEYACSSNTAGNQLLFTAGDETLSHRVRSTGTWDDYQWHSLGTITLAKGATGAALRSAGPVSSYLMDYRTILLNPR